MTPNEYGPITAEAKHAGKHYRLRGESLFELTADGEHYIGAVPGGIALPPLAPQTATMSLRDHFAGLAMQGFASDPQMAIGIRETAEQSGISTPEMMARTAYGLADAMIAERNRTGGG